MYTPVNPKIDFAKEEEAILAFWKKNDIFEKSIINRENSPEYVFFDGPPFATGLPHFGHFLPNTIKDIIPRYQTMKGKKVDRRFGWDCHGLPVENLVEKDLRLNSKTDIEQYGVDKFNEACRASVLRYVKEWEEVITRLGRWVDFKHDYKTMEPDYMESIWHVVKQLWDSNLLYEGFYILPYCPRCSTVLSNHELNLGGYKDVHDPAITVKFKVVGTVASLSAGTAFESKPFADNTYLLAWTTTPWTLPSNLGLAIGSDIDYVMIKDGSEQYILAESRLNAYYKEAGDYEIIWRKKGSQLEGIRYEPLFPYFADLVSDATGKTHEGKDGVFYTFAADFVTTSDGTGIVHTAPGFGEEDYAVFKSRNLPAVCPIDAECKFTAEVYDYTGQFVKDTDKAIIERLKTEGKLVKRDQILHSYPHCWRCSSPLIYRAITSWFVAVQKIKPRLLAANAQIHWQPAHIRDGRFGKWLEGARDWAISRNRYWGNPLPIWRCSECKKQICLGSRKELEEYSKVSVKDLHKHFVDSITIPCECGATMHRIPEVLDCWFESGAMPYAQQHYPFENKEYFENHFPADFISEGLDQTRGWFYTLTILAAALHDKPAFQNCIVNGLVLASDGKKMSKSLRNYTDPVKVISSFGADALRLFLMNSNAVKADDLKYSDEGVRDVLKGILIPLWNSYSFYVTYANIDNFTPSPIVFEKEAEFFKTLLNPLDRWILSVTEQLVQKVTTAMDEYDLAKAIEPIVGYIDELNNWYIRRSRRRFWKSENDSDKSQAYETLYRALKKFILVAAPVIPFITENIWQNIKQKTDPDSIHLADYPEYNSLLRDELLEFKMKTVQKAVSMGRALRYQFNIKIRQPLSSVQIVTRNPDEKRVLLEMEESIIDELNVKEVIFHEKENELVEYSAKANFRILGREFGSLMKPLAALIEQMKSEEIQSLLEGSTLSFDVKGKTVDLTADKIIVNRIEKASLKVVNEGTLTVGLDTEINRELLLEGAARDLVRGIQNLRKEKGLDVVDKIRLVVSETDNSDILAQAFKIHKEYIMNETLSVEATWTDTLKSPGTVIDSNDLHWETYLEKV